LSPGNRYRFKLLAKDCHVKNDLTLSRREPAPAPQLWVNPAAAKAAFHFHFNPVDLAETTLVDELARRAAQMHAFDAGLVVLREEGEAALTNVLNSPVTDARASQQIAIAGVLGSGRHEALLRQGLASARGFARALRELHDSRSRALAPGWNNTLVVDPRFNTEPACWAHLVRRYAYGKCGCGACGAIAEGTFVAARICWQCGRCRAQTGLRVGTCTERSAIALTKWFAAIRGLLLDPTVAVADLATFLQIPRRQTVGKMIERIRTAADSADATTRLAGLDQLYLGQLI
jgi:hypothetical protein